MSSNQIKSNHILTFSHSTIYCARVRLLLNTISIDMFEETRRLSYPSSWGADGNGLCDGTIRRCYRETADTFFFRLLLFLDV